MKKKILAMLLAVCMVASMVPAAFAAGTFTDVPAGEWYAEEVEYVYANGLMGGVGEGRFSPNGDVSRAMVWTTLARLAGENTAGSEPWWLAGQQWMMATGISDGTGAENAITREQLATMLWRYAKFMGYDVSVGERTSIHSYSDAFSVSEWAVEAMQWVCGAGIINGINGALQPQKGATRAQLAVILYRFVEGVVKAEPVTPVPTPTPSTPVHVCVVVSTSVVAPTCTEQGYTVYTTCCHSSYTGNYVSATGHKDGKVCCDGKIHAYTEAGLVKAVAEGGNIVLEADIVLTAPIIVTGTMTVDLNGKTMSYGSAVAGEDMITNKGVLTITDTSVGKNGKITYSNTDATASNVTVSTISTEPGSTLVVKSGTVENKSVKASGSTIYPYAIDILTNGNLGDVTVTIEGGTVYSDYMAIRQFNNGDACKNTLTVSGGKIYGATRAVQVHLKNDAAYTTISGGEIEGGDYSLCFLTTSKNISVTGGAFIGSVWYSGTTGFITGGTFDSEPNANYIAEGYEIFANEGTYTVGVQKIDTAEELIAAIEKGGTVTLADNVEIDADTTITIASGKTVTLDLNEKNLTGKTDGTGNREMFLVKGTMTVTNGTVTMEASNNQGWNAMTTVFDVTAGGVLNITDTTIKNQGGTDMNFCVHMNNWGEVTLNVSGSTLEATYCAVRVFNSGPDMNNVTIENSTLEATAGSRAFWVHNYTSVDFGGKLYSGATAAYDEDTVLARMNFDIYNNGNTFKASTNANPILYGFTDSIRFNAEGVKV